MVFIELKPGTEVYLTRNSRDDYVRVFPHTKGIRKFRAGRGAEWGASWCKRYRSIILPGKRSPRTAPCMTLAACRKKYDFAPRPGTAYLITYTPTGRQRNPVKVDIAFS